MKVTLTPRQQAILLGGLIVLLVGVVVWRVMAMNTPVATVASQAGSGARPSNQAGANQRGQGAQKDVPVSGVKLDALKHEDEELPEAERNPFRFRPKAPPPPPPRATAPPVQTYVPPPQPQGPPPPPPIPLRYVGFLDAPNRVAVLTDARGTPYYGKEGEIIDGRYRVLRVAPDSVDIAYADGRGRQTLRMTQPPQ